ncbi:MAG: hypothetical protein R3E66_07220 [bacterium]
MNAIKAMLEVTEHGRPAAVQWQAQRPKTAVLDALAFAREHDGLAASQPWALASRTARELEDAFGYAPHGGWIRFIGLATGAGWFTAQPDRFVARAWPHELIEVPPEVVQKRLVESFTQMLCPPQAMAGMLVTLDLHPMWGLRVAHDVQVGAADGEIRDESIFPRQTRDAVARMIFGTIASFVSVLWKLDPTNSYPMDPMANLFYECASVARNAVKDTIDAPSRPLPVFMGTDISQGRALTDFLHADIFDALLVPANLAQYTPDGRVVVRSDVLRTVGVGQLGSEEIEHWGEWLSSVPAVMSIAC